MAASLYTSGVSSIMGGDIDLINDDITALLIDNTNYTPDFDLDANQSDIPAAARIIEASLTGKTLDSSTFRADDLQITGLESGSISSIVIIQNTGDYNTSRLIAFLEAPELPIEADGTPITIQWDTGINGIFKL